MRKDWTFNIGKDEIKVTNSWSGGIKLYVNGDLRDHDITKFTSKKYALLSTNLGEQGILEINPSSSMFSVEIDAYLVQQQNKELIYSSYQRLSLKQQRLSKETH